MRLRRTGYVRGQRTAARLRCPPPNPSPTCPQPSMKMWRRGAERQPAAR